MKKLSPMLCASDDTTTRILGQKGWLFELKLDGVRIVAEKAGARVALSYRKSRDATESYREIAEAVQALAVPDVILDGEIVAFDEEGRPDFMRLSSRIQSQGRSKTDIGVAYVVFDVLAIGENDVRSLPIEERKKLLAEIIPEGSRAIRIHPTFEDGEKLFALCKEHGLEGVVAKRAGSIYRSGDRTSDWVKVKHVHDGEFVVVAWNEGEGKRSRLGALDLASWEDGQLVLRGAVGSGLSEDTIDVLLETLRPLETSSAVVKGRFTSKGRRRHHVRPELVVSVRYSQITPDGILRHAVFRGIRTDLGDRDPETVDYVAFEGDVARSLAERAGFPVVIVGRAVVIPLGGAPRAVAEAFSALFARLSGAKVLPGLRIERATWPAPLDIRHAIRLLEKTMGTLK